MGPKVLLPLGLLAVIVGVLQLWSPRSGSPARPRRVEATSRPLPTLAAPAEPSVQRPRTTPAGPETQPSPPPPLDGSDHEPQAVAWLHGSVTVVDPAGISHHAEDGQLVLRILHPDKAAFEQVSVVGGSWSCRVPADLRIALGGLELGGRVAYSTFGPGQSVAVPADRFLALEATWPPATVLVVQDAETGQPLDGLEIVSGLGELTGLHPGRPERLKPIASGVASPVELVPTHPGISAESFFVRKPGHGWAAVEVDFRLGGERLVELARSGGLRVTLSRPPAPGELLAIWRDGDHAPELELLLEGEGSVIELDSLLPGERRVEVRRGHWFAESVTVGEGRAAVVPGASADVSLVLAPTPDVVTAPLSGTLTVTDGWRPGPRDLFLRLKDVPLGGEDEYLRVEADEMLAVSGERDTYRWSVERLQTGRWTVQLSDPAVEFEVEVVPGGPEVELVLPPPARVRLSVLEVDGSPADVDRVLWNPWREQGGVVNAVERGDEPGVFEFTCAQRRIQISAPSDEYARTRAEFAIEPGLNELTMTVERDCGVVVVLMDGDTVLPWDWSWNVRAEWSRDPLRKRTGEGSTSSGGWRFRSDRPGTCRVVVEDIPGYRPVAPLDIEVEPGPHRTVELPLVRLR